MGGAKNPIGQLNDDVSKEKKSQPEEYVLGAKSTPTEIKYTQTEMKSSQTEEVSMKTGSLPGDRFKQLKEEEARRKRQREQAKIQTEAAVGKATLTKDEHQKQESAVETANGTVAGLVDERNRTDQSATSAGDDSGDGHVNGEVSGVASEEPDNKSNLMNKNGRPTNETKEQQLADTGKEAVEVQSRLSSMDQSSEEEMS